jgi:hypothetical protein
VLVPRVRIQGGSQEADGQDREPVHPDIDPLAAGVSQGLRDEPGREREQDHREQDKQVEAQEELIDPGELIGQGGVEEPRAADRQEAGEVGQVGGPGVERLLQGCAGRVKRKVHYEQRDGESEHAVAESFHPVLAEDPASAGCLRQLARSVSFAPIGSRWQSQSRSAGSGSPRAR